MSNKPIGVLDSGSGGLSILSSIHRLLPHESLIYLGDHAYIPYGNRSSDLVNARVVSVITFLLSKQVKLIVVACNTATVSGIDYYRSLFPNVPIVGVVPVIKTAAKITKTNHFLVLSTSHTAKSRYQKELIHKFAPLCDVTNVGSPRLVMLIENNDLDSSEVKHELQYLLQSFDPKKHDVIVLGCTHYPFLIHEIRAIVGKDIHILDSGDAVARQVGRILEHRNELCDKEHESTKLFFTTGEAMKVSIVLSRLMNADVNAKHVTI
jgi:glutamate racemase